MKLNSRVTWGLAWAGLALVIAVPSADMVASQFSPSQAMVIDEPMSKAPKAAASQVALVAPIPAPRPAGRDQAVAAVKPQPPVAAPVKTDVAANATDPVDRFVSTGKKLPSYITGGDDTLAQAPAKPAVVQQPAAPTQVASTASDKPVTWGESKWGVTGGKDPVGTLGADAAKSNPAAVAPVETVTNVASIQPTELVAPVPMPASMRPKSVAVKRPAPVAVDPTTVASFDNSDRVTARDLQDWESGPLSDFLAKRAQGRRIAQQPQRLPQYDPQADGDFIEYDAAPQYLGPVENGSFFIWN